MHYYKNIVLKDNRGVTLRNGIEFDASDVLSSFKVMHEETDFLLSYPEENTMDEKKEALFLKKMAESPNEIELLAVLDGKVIGLAGLNSVGTRYKVSHRAEFGVSILKSYWNKGLGLQMTNAIIECAKKASYKQLELSVVADNSRAIAMYEKAGFVVFSRNPMGFKSKTKGYQELISMRLALD